MRRTLVTVALAFACILISTQPALASSRELPPAVPFYVVGHLLAPVGNIVGWVLVEPFVYLFEAAPLLFELD